MVKKSAAQNCKKMQSLPVIDPNFAINFGRQALLLIIVM